MSATTRIAGRWTLRAAFEVASMDGARWHTSTRKLTLLRGPFHVLAVAEIRGAGAEERWYLMVTGWAWQMDGVKAFTSTKRFMTRAGAMLEAEDIIQSASAARA